MEGSKLLGLAWDKAEDALSVSFPGENVEKSALAGKNPQGIFFVVLFNFHDVFLSFLFVYFTNCSQQLKLMLCGYAVMVISANILVTEINGVRMLKKMIEKHKKNQCHWINHTYRDKQIIFRN